MRIGRISTACATSARVLATCAATVPIAIAVPAGASAHARRHSSHRHHNGVRHVTTPRRLERHGEHGRQRKHDGAATPRRPARHDRRAANVVKTTRAPHARPNGQRPQKTHAEPNPHAARPTQTRHPKTATEPAKKPATEPAGACNGTDLTPNPENIEAAREATLCLINRERALHGERALKPNAKLARCALGHSESMAQEDYFSHEGPDGSTPLSRMQAAGYIYSPKIGYEIGENIAWGTLWLATPKAIVESWMQSPEHRENILDANYTDTGIGVIPHAPTERAEGQAGAVYTQDFGVIITS
ncbi:MAG TPA: CAP domain-containing protein [Solirubrobacteraceae bacterium]|nr:CAP domain-containing protein [Solirubrobacteraceae bacterium]